MSIYYLTNYKLPIDKNIYKSGNNTLKLKFYIKFNTQLFEDSS